MLQQTWISKRSSANRVADSVRVVFQFKLAEKVCGAQEHWLLCEGSVKCAPSQHLLLSSVSLALHASALTKFSQKQVTEHITRRRIFGCTSWMVTTQAQMRHYPLQTRPTETGQNTGISVPPRPKFPERNECIASFSGEVDAIRGLLITAGEAAGKSLSRLNCI